MRTGIPMFLIISMLTISCGSDLSQTENQNLVATSILPLHDFVRQIGGSDVQSFVIIPPGASPHTFELVPTIMRKIDNSQALVLNGLGLEPWAERVIDTVGEKEIWVINASSQIAARDIKADHDHLHGEHESKPHTSGNPHVWLNPVLAINQVEQIAAGLAKVYPAHADSFFARQDRYTRKLVQLDKEIQDKVNTWSHRDFVCFHPAWEYFAHRYGLNQAAVITDRPGMEPSPSRMADVIETIKQTGAKAVFGEPQFSESLLKTIARETNVSVIQLDPLGTTLEGGGYIELMRSNVSAMARALN